MSIVFPTFAGLIISSAMLPQNPHNLHKYNKIPQQFHRHNDVTCSATGGFVADMQRRTIMNVLLLSSAAAPVAWMAGGYIDFFVPASGSDTQSGIAALDADGNPVTESDWVRQHPFPERNLVQGLKGDAHYIIAKEDNSLEKYALNAVCTHLGCVVPWNRAANKYMCPCHGSQYDMTGKVIRGPAPLSLALAHVDITDDKVMLSKWTETDFRTNEKPWWK